MSHSSQPRRRMRLAAIAAVAAAMAAPAAAGLFDRLIGPATVQFTSGGAALAEGGTATLTVRLSRPALGSVTVPLTAGGDALAGRDYQASLPASLRFRPLETSQTIVVQTLDDADVEPAETLTLTLGTPSGARLGSPAQYRLQIDDNDVATLPTLAFASAAASGSEAQASQIEIVLSAPSAQAVTVELAVAGTASAGADYTLAPAGTLRFEPGQTRRTLTITPVDDSAVESAETVVLTLRNAANATLGATSVHTRTILDNDAPPSAGKWVSGYYVGYARGLYPPEVVDYSALTHLMLGRITPRADGTLNKHFDIDDVEGPAWAHDVVTRAHAAGKKVIVMLGGDGAHDEFVAAASDANRARFVQNLVALAAEFGFDGFDLDWEPIVVDPGNGIDERVDFRKLAEALRAAAPDKLLTVPIGWINNNFASEEADPFWGQVAPLFDQINIMSYGMASGFWNWESWHSSALYGETGMAPSSIASTVRAWREIGGIPAAKLGIGIGFYGSCWRYVTEPHQIAVSTPGGLPVNGADDNQMSYTNIMTLYYPQATPRRDLTAMVPYLTTGNPNSGVGPQQCTFMSYDDAWSIGEKAKFVKDNGLGGTIVWTINQGYLPNAPAGQRDPLMQALKDGFLAP
ncbi:glycosyl hydrolase family 18 protein [Solimonas variicoloris]|uniref:glycosyl hydrolase family 18 protein n=1 Tax=Solimonas variicoloris TaxID=254408 RepID=UPI00039F627E|nr:glycosyl hydrolase family 18 protein [Solimonas variicoloris]